MRPLSAKNRYTVFYLISRKGTFGLSVTEDPRKLWNLSGFFFSVLDFTAFNIFAAEPTTDGGVRQQCSDIILWQYDGSMDLGTDYGGYAGVPPALQWSLTRGLLGYYILSGIIGSPAGYSLTEGGGGRGGVCLGGR